MKLRRLIRLMSVVATVCGLMGCATVKEVGAMRLNVKEYGAVGDGVTLDSGSIRAALGVLKANGGGELYFPEGTYLAGGIELFDHVTLNLAKGAVLLASPTIDDHYLEPRLADIKWLKHYFIYGKGARDIRIMGDGVIDGNGRAYWEDVYLCGVPFDKMPPNPSMVHYNVLTPKSLRPVTVYFEDCIGVDIRNVLVRHAAAFTIWTVSCRDVTIENVTIRNHRYGPNTDALDIDCSQNVLIKGCDIDAGDDCIAIKSDPFRFGRQDPCENITVTNCRLTTSTCAIRIGYEGDSPIRNLDFSNLHIVDSRHGIDILSICPDRECKIFHGTPMDNFRFSNIYMTNVAQAIYVWAANEGTKTSYTGYIRNLLFENIQAEAVASSFIGCEKSGIITNVTMRNVNMHVAKLDELKPVTDFSKMPSQWGDWWMCGGLRLHNVKEVAMVNCNITCDQPGFKAIEQEMTK